MTLSKDKQLEVVRTCYRYECTSAVVDGEELMRYTIYGIRAKDEAGTVVACYDDVSTQQDFVNRLVELCNQGMLDPLHLGDVLLDYLG